MVELTVEIGHTYAPDVLVPGIDHHEFGHTPEAQKLRKIARGLGEDALVVALVDDILISQNMQQSSDPARAGAFLIRSAESVQTGTEARVVKFESSFVPRAREMVEEIRGMELPNFYRLSKTGEKLIFGQGKARTRIPLFGFSGIEEPTHPSCQMLDLAWLEHRLSLAPKAVTVLPRSYQEQQRHVKALASLFPHLQGKTIETIFIDE